MTASLARSQSALESLLQEETPSSGFYPEHLDHLAKQILHNLEHQHRWTDLKIHTKAATNERVFPRPMISGLPPKRLYMHPDEQAHLLKQQSHRRNASSSPVNSDDSKANALEAPIAEWVLPTHVREKWTLRQFAEVFDVLDEPVVTQEQTWDVHKRVVLATLQDDSTIVYYIMNDGIVKPRQN